jgi:DNA-binding NtrC family response regulator
VITDLGMPDMTGWEVARAINGRSPEIPVLLLTGWGERVQVPEGTQVAGILTKPFDVDRLTAAVARALGGRA